MAARLEPWIMNLYKMSQKHNKSHKMSQEEEIMEPELDEMVSPDPEQNDFERKWTAVIDKTCSVKDCYNRQYGQSGVCFQCLLKQIGC